MRRPKGQEQKSLHVCFGAVGLQPFLVFCVFCLFYKNTVVSPWKRVILFISQCLPFTSPFSLSVTLSFFTLSLSLSLSCFLFFFPSLLSCFLSFLVFLLLFLALFLCFCFTKNNIKYYIWKVSFHYLFSVFCFFFLGGGVLFCFVLQIPFLIFCLFVLSVVCFCQHKCFHFSKKTISKTPSFVLRIVQSYRLFKGRFWGKIWLMFEKAL